MSVLVINSYFEYQLIHTFLENLQKVRKYFAQIEIHQAEFRREENFIDQKSLSISDLQIDYLILDNSVGNTERANVYQWRWSHFGGSHLNGFCFKQHIKNKGHKKSTFNSLNFNNKRTERNGWKPNTCMRCVLENYLSENCLKPNTSAKKVHWNTENTKTRS